MKVLYIVHSTLMGGATISFLNMISEVKKYGVSPVIVIPKKKHHEQYFLEKAKSLGVKVLEAKLVPLTFRGVPNVKNIKAFLKAIMWVVSLPYKQKVCENSVERIIRHEKPDIVHSNTGVIHEGWKVCQKLGIPHVWHLREYQDVDFGYKIFPSRSKFENMLRRSAVVTITKDILRYFHQTNNPFAYTVYNGIFHTKEAVYVKEKENYFLICSRISPEKGHEDAIKAFSIFCKTNKDYKLKILGKYDKNNPYIMYLQKLINDTGCSEKVEFIGFHKDVKPYIKKAKALIVASHNEGFGRMTAEACFLGCLVIGRNTSGTKEILDYTGGVQYDGTLDDLSEKILSVSIMEQQEYAAIAMNAMKKAMRQYSIESNGSEIFNIYNNILSSNHEKNS